MKTFLVRETWRELSARRYDADTAQEAAIAAARHYTPVVPAGEVRYEDYWVFSHGDNPDAGEQVRVRFEYRLNVEVCS